MLPRLPRLAESARLRGLFSPSTLDAIWEDATKHSSERLSAAAEASNNLEYTATLNSTTAPTNLSFSSSNPAIDRLLSISKIAATNHIDAPVFSSANDIINRYYFLSSLKPLAAGSLINVSTKNSLLETPDYSEIVLNKPYNEDFIAKINQSFGSWEEFVNLFIASAKSINGNGYTWLVHRGVNSKEKSSFKEIERLAIVNTYNNGTPTEFLSKQVSDAKNHNQIFSEKNSEGDVLSVEAAQERSELFSHYSNPLVGVAVSPEFYLRDYGAFGKDKYVENAVKAIDWDIVVSRLK